MENVEELIGKHLGRTADGTKMEAYKTPDQIDPGLLVAIPRSENRQKYDIDQKFFDCVTDVWNCYEFSTLLGNGMPVCGTVKIIFNGTSKIVESKSLKLYLNSFNNHRWAEPYHCVQLENKIRMDLKKIIPDGMIEVKLKLNGHFPPPVEGVFPVNYIDLDSYFSDLGALSDVSSSETPEYLKIVPGHTPHLQCYKTSILRSNCRITNQPDWADVYISVLSKKVDVEGLYKYIASFRNENHFHEEICEMICKRMVERLDPSKLIVACFYTRRGGIDINPIRVYDRNPPNKFFRIANEREYLRGVPSDFMAYVSSDISPKTLRQ